MTAVTGQVRDFSLERRPRDFAARYRRSRVPSLRSLRARSHLGKRAALLLAAVAVPAMAAPGEWSAFAVGDAGRWETQIEPMPFERSGDSFPGSAFYYLAADEAPGLGEGIHSDAEPAPTAFGAIVGPAARALRIDNSGVDRGRALQCLTAAIYYEAASEPDAGQRAVAQVVLNRVAHPAYPNSVCGVVYQGSERRTGCQFSFTCDGSLARVPSRMFWLRAQAVAEAALAGYVYAPVGLATHYHTIAIHPYWADSLTSVGVIGYHRFYRFGGRAGSAGTFRFAYAGGEPLPAPHPRTMASDRATEAVADPAAVQQAFDTAYRSAVAQSSGGSPSLAPIQPAPPPVYAGTVQQRGGESLYRGNNLPGSSNVRPEFQNSGRWIARPES